MNIGWSAATIAWLAAAGGVALTALYLLRHRRTRIVVPFVPLWFPTAGDNRARRRARRLRRWLSWALQLVIFGLLLLAASDPRPAIGRGGGRNVVILVDRSASMGALDEPGTRLGRARTLARAVIHGLGPDDRALVATFAADVTAASGFESDQTRLGAAVDAISASDEPGDPNSALKFSAALLRARSRPTLILVSDGDMPDVSDTSVTAALRDIDVRFQAVGRRGDNLAIVAFSARRMPADPSSVELTIVVHNFRAAKSDVVVAIAAGPQHIVVARRTLHVAPGARVATTLSNVPNPDSRLEASLENVSDDLPLDNRAYAVVPEPAPFNVQVVGARNLYLDAALLSLGKAVHVTHVAPAALEGRRDRWANVNVDADADADARADVVIFDGVMPKTAPRTGRFLYIDPHGPTSPWADRGEIADPVITDVLADHPLIKQLSLTDLNVARARRLTLQPGDTAVASALRVPLVVARIDKESRLIALAFDLRRSDFPLRGAFPLFLANALSWLGARPATEALSWPTGRTVRIAIPAGLARGGIREVSVVSPDGRHARAPVAADGVTLSLDRVGITEVLLPDGTGVARVAANLASSAESDTTPRPALTIGERTPGPPDAPHPRRRHEPWLVALLAALVLSAGEWIGFHRRLTV